MQIPYTLSIRCCPTVHRMPGKDSLWLLEQLRSVLPELPQIIFTTAFSDPYYLLKAIKFSATDYLNKPIHITELAQAVEKAKKKIRKKNAADKIPGTKIYTFRSLHSQLLLSAKDIVYIKADGNYADIILLQGKNESVFERLGEIAKKLDEEIFIRTGRSIIVNRTYVRKLNTKECICTLITPYESYNIPISKDACKELSLRLSRDLNGNRFSDSL